MMFTSGTTGRPKGVLLNHSGLKLCHDRARIMEFRETDVQLTYLPLFHIYAFGYSVLMSFMCGASQVMMEVFNGEQALHLIEKYRVSVIHGFEAHFSDLLAAQSKQGLDISTLRIASFATGAESVRELAEKVQADLCETASSYGLTETWGGVTISAPGATMSQRCEASGLPQPGIDIRIVDAESGRILPHNTIGEIQVRSYARMIGYHEDPEATAAVLDKDGWFRTGDAGLLREDGYLRCLARYKDMLKVGGENVAPAEIEELLCAIPGIRAAAVVGQKDNRLQEVPVAFVVAQHDRHPSESEVIEFFRGKIANFKIPARVIFLDELPMTPTGKVQKEMLRQRLLSETVV
jgi:fatty-acyl-CoA synthase